MQTKRYRTNKRKNRKSRKSRKIKGGSDKSEILEIIPNSNNVNFVINEKNVKSILSTQQLLQIVNLIKTETEKVDQNYLDVQDRELRNLISRIISNKTAINPPIDKRNYNFVIEQVMEDIKSKREDIKSKRKNVMENVNIVMNNIKKNFPFVFLNSGSENDPSFVKDRIVALIHARKISKVGLDIDLLVADVLQSMKEKRVIISNLQEVLEREIEEKEMIFEILLNEVSNFNFELPRENK